MGRNFQLQVPNEDYKWIISRINLNPNRSACCANFTCSLKSICSLFLLSNGMDRPNVNL